MRKSRRKRRRRRRTRRRGAGKKRRKQTFQPWKGKHSFNNNDISYYARSVESEGNFPDTTNGELSMEKTIEGQQPRDDGGGGGEGVGEGVGDGLATPPAKNDYFFPSAAHAVAGRPADSAAAGTGKREELTKTEQLMRELADSPAHDELKVAVEKAELEMKREKRRAHSRVLREAGVSTTEKFATKDPWLEPHILQDPQTRTSLEKMRRDASPVFFGLADGVRTVSPEPSAAEGERRDREEAEADYRQMMKTQRQWEKAAEYDKEEAARAAAAAAARDPKVREAARWAADEWDASDDEGLMFRLDKGGGRRKRRAKNGLVMDLLRQGGGYLIIFFFRLNI